MTKEKIVTPTTSTTTIGSKPSVIDNLTALAALQGITLPDLVDPAPAADFVEVPAVPVKKRSDAAIVKKYVTHLGGFSMDVPSDYEADEAAKRLGQAKLLNIASRLGNRAVADFVFCAFWRRWLPASLEVLTALSERMAVVELVHTAGQHHCLDAAVTVTDLTRLAGNGQGALARVTSLWNTMGCPEGIVDHSVIAALDLSGTPEAWFATKPRISTRSMNYIVNTEPRLAGFAVHYGPVGYSAAQLVTFYDKGLAATADLDPIHGQAYLLSPVVHAMVTSGHTTKAVVSRCVAALRSSGIYRRGGSSELIHFVLEHQKLSDDEVVGYVYGSEIFSVWLDDGFTANPANEALAVRVANEMVKMHQSLTVAMEIADLNRTQNGVVLNHPERYEWLIDAINDDWRAPGMLRRDLAKPVDPHSLKGILVKAAATAFAEAPAHVQERLWRAVVAGDSVIMAKNLSFNAATKLFIQRDMLAANRVAARAPKATAEVAE